MFPLPKLFKNLYFDKKGNKKNFQQDSSKNFEEGFVGCANLHRSDFCMTFDRSQNNCNCIDKNYHSLSNRPVAFYRGTTRRIWTEVESSESLH